MAGPKKADLSREYGLVLEGGGSRGAYQVGAWKALAEGGLKIKGIAGVSVGALNGALMTMGDLERAENLWYNIRYSDVMNVSDEDMEKLIHGKLLELDPYRLRHDMLRTLTEGGLDITPLRQLIHSCMDEDKIRNSPIDFWLGTYSLTDHKEIAISAKEMEPGTIEDYLMASAYLPGFKNVPLVDGKSYVDGGVVNKLPVDMLIHQGYKDIILLRVYGFGVERKVKIPDDVNIYEICPHIDLGNILDFDTARSRRNMKAGYFDGLRFMRGLAGKIYYIDADYPEEFYAALLANLPEAARMVLVEWAGLDYTKPEALERQMFEFVFPAIAAELKLSADWTYGELTIAMAEVCAKNLRLNKYEIYTLEQFIARIDEKYEEHRKSEVHFPVFVEVLMRALILSQDYIRERT